MAGAAMSASVSSVMAGVLPALLPVFLLESLPVSVAVPAASLAGPSMSSVLEELEGFVTGVVAGFVVCVLDVLEESDGFTAGFVAGFDSCVWLVAGVVGFVVLTELLPVVLGFCCTSGTAITAFELSLRLPKSSTTRPGTVPPVSGKIL